MKRLLVVAASVTALVGAGASAALAGEVKGPPNQVNNTNYTPVVGHDGASGTANSACAASGLNDFANGQTASQVQTAADSWKYYGEPKGSVGTDCRGATGSK